MVPLISFAEINLNTIAIAIVGAIGAYYMAVIKKDVNSNATAAADREKALRQTVDALGATVQDLREERARSSGQPANPPPASSPAIMDPGTPLVVLDPTVGPDPNAPKPKGK